MKTPPALRSTAGPLSIACFSFLAGALAHAAFTHTQSVQAADTHRVFELMVYHTLPGKTPALESTFHNVSRLQAKHGLDAIGYWVPESDDPAWQNTFVYLVAHPSREAADRNWSSLHADPAFQPYFQAAAPLIEHTENNYNVDEIYMRPTSYSEVK